MTAPAASVRTRCACNPKVFATFADGRLPRIRSAASNSLCFELPADELPKRPGGATGGQRGLRERRREGLEVQLDLVSRGRESLSSGWVVGEEAAR